MRLHRLREQDLRGVALVSVSLRWAQRAQKRFAVCRGLRPLPLQLTSRSSRRRIVAAFKGRGGRCIVGSQPSRCGAA